MRIKDWEKFQHFKDRRPPWIKLYRKLLDDPEWHSLSPMAAKTLIMLWLLASEDDAKIGTLPDLKTCAFRLRLSEKALESACCELSHFLYQDDINVISHPRQLGPSETETETETETDFCAFWNAYPRKIGRKAAHKAWTAAKDRPPLPRIVSALTTAKQSPDWTKDNGKFIPHPATWLNQGRWDDVLTVPPRKERLPL